MSAENRPYVHLPKYLRPETPPAAICFECGRKSWDRANVGQRCNMPQPNGSRCPGRMDGTPNA